MDIHYFDAMGRARKSYAQLMEPICQRWSLTRNELDVLLFLYNNPGYDRAADIVTHRGIAKSHVSLSVANLEGKGLLIRHFEPADRRTAHLTLTDGGREIAQQGREMQHIFFTRIFADLTPEEFAQWRVITEKVCRNIEKLDEIG